MPTTGAAIERFGTVAGGQARRREQPGRAGAGLGRRWRSQVVWLAALGLFLYGVGTGVWDVGMNVEGAAVEGQLRRTVMPRFHAAFSLGTVAGSGLGAAAVGLGVPTPWHLPPLALLAVAMLLGSTPGVPARPSPRSHPRPRLRPGAPGASRAPC